MKTMTFAEATADFADMIAEYAKVNPEDAAHIAKFYESDYNAANEGEATVWGRFTFNPTKGDVIDDYRCYLKRNLGKI